MPSSTLLDCRTPKFQELMGKVREHNFGQLPAFEDSDVDVYVKSDVKGDLFMNRGMRGLARPLRSSLMTLRLCHLLPCVGVACSDKSLKHVGEQYRPGPLDVHRIILLLIEDAGKLRVIYRLEGSKAAHNRTDEWAIVTPMVNAWREARELVASAPGLMGRALRSTPRHQARYDQKLMALATSVGVPPCHVTPCHLPMACLLPQLSIIYWQVRGNERGAADLRLLRLTGHRGEEDEEEEEEGEGDEEAECRRGLVSQVKGGGGRGGGGVLFAVVYA